MSFDISQNQDNAELLALFAKGNRLSTISLTSRLAPIIFSQAFHMLNNRADAEDVTQEALLQLWKIAPKWDPNRAQITTWLYRVTSNLCIDRFRKSKRVSSEEMPEVIDKTPDVDQKMQFMARSKALYAGLKILPDRQRQAIVLRHLEELSNPDISEIMEISIEAVESLIARGKRSLVLTLVPQKKALGLNDD